MISAFVIYWCVNDKVGLQLFITALFCTWVVAIYKHLSEGWAIKFEFSWVIIALIFFGYFFLRKNIENLFLKGGRRLYFISTAVLSFLMILYRPGWEYVIPGGVLLGIGLGYCLCKRFVGFKCSDVCQRKGIAKFFTLFARFFIGFGILVIIIYRVDKIIQLVLERQNIFLYTFLCCGLVGLWISILAPWVFIKLRLAGTGDGQDERQQ